MLCRMTQRKRGDRDVQSIEDIKGGGPALGLLPTATFQTNQIEVVPGDFLLFFTDGVIEAEGAGNEFGLAGLRNSVRANLHQPTAALLDATIRDVFAFSGSDAFVDDVCLVAAELVNR
jgi:phosphoserine phosphatase RsbU/P